MAGNWKVYEISASTERRDEEEKKNEYDENERRKSPLSFFSRLFPLFIFGAAHDKWRKRSAAQAHL